MNTHRRFSIGWCHTYGKGCILVQRLLKQRSYSGRRLLWRLARTKSSCAGERAALAMTSAARSETFAWARSSACAGRNAIIESAPFSLESSEYGRCWKRSHLLHLSRTRVVSLAPTSCQMPCSQAGSSFQIILQNDRNKKKSSILRLPHLRKGIALAGFVWCSRRSVIHPSLYVEKCRK